MKFFPMRSAFSTLAIAAALTAWGQVTAYDFDPAGFGLAGGAGTAVNFDTTAEGTDIGGASLGGATFTALGSPLLVVAGAGTFTPPGVFSPPGDATNVLIPTSGRMVLSPGGKELGSGPSLDRDSFEIKLAQPSSSFGFDLLAQSLDFALFTSIELYDSGNVLLYSSGLASPPGSGGGGAPGGTAFFGYVSTVPISRIRILESDDDTNNPDANIGVDTLRFKPVPEPATWAALAVGAASMLRRRRAQG